MIIYNPTDGDAITSPVQSCPKQCFLMTRLGKPVPKPLEEIRHAVTECCREIDYEVIDASSKVTGRDFLLKIWKLIAATPLSIGICHEEIPASTQANIYYELGVAQALGKETLIVKSAGMDVPSDFVRTEYVEYGGDFKRKFIAYLNSLFEQADHYELVADQLDRNPLLALDYLKRAYLITGDQRIRTKAHALLDDAELENRAQNSVEVIAQSF